MEGNGGLHEGMSGREVFLYLCWGGQLECGGNGLLSYVGGRTDCVWLRHDMRLEDVIKAVEGTIEEGLRGRTLWYSTKYDRKMLMQLQRDGDVGKLVKGNEEYGYMYIVERDVPMWKSVHVKEVGDTLGGCCGSQQSGGGGSSEEGRGVRNGGQTGDMLNVRR